MFFFDLSSVGVLPVMKVSPPLLACSMAAGGLLDFFGGRRAVEKPALAHGQSLSKPEDKQLTTHVKS